MNPMRAGHSWNEADVGAQSDRMAEAMRRSALAVSRVGGSDVFEDLVSELAAILGVDVAFTAVFSDDKRTHLRTLAAWLDGKLLRTFEYPLAGSPCAAVVGREFRFVEVGSHRSSPPGRSSARKAWTVTRRTRSTIPRASHSACWWP